VKSAEKGVSRGRRRQWPVEQTRKGYPETPAARLIVDKMPGNALPLGLVAMLMPGARVNICWPDLSAGPCGSGLSISCASDYLPHAHDLADRGCTWARTNTC
jgi:hypothetical protein